jgi:hypothetical protein
MADDETCSSCSLGYDEDPGGTASRQRCWLLIEQTGAWGPNALLESKIPEPVARAIDERRRAAGVRVLLIRRGPGALAADRRRWAFVRATATDPHMGGGWFTEPEELLDLDLDALASEEVTLPDAGPGPLVAVCTHGRHDRCCADNGRPVARRLRQAGVDAWECSHVGGDRFAANVVSFPHGLFHGRVTPATALPVVHAYAEGRIHPAGFRGRAAWSPAAQKAEILLRHELDEWGVEALDLAGHDIDGGRHTIRFGVDGAVHEVVVEVGRDEHARLLACSNAAPGHPRVITPVSIRTV